MKEIKFRAWDKELLYEVETIAIPNDNRGAHNFKGYEISGGYVLRKVKNHPFSNRRGYYPEHRLVMEQHLRRFLKEDEVIHHIDGNRKNNELNNLELVINQSKHASMEMVGKRNPNGRLVAKEQAFQDIKFRLYDKDRGITKVYCLSKLIGTTFRRGKFEFRGRWTGIKDKNGVEVYEGDIVRGRDSFLAGFSQKDNLFGVVDFQDGSFVIKNDYVTHYRWMDYELEVIGNVFENSDLLK